MRARETHLNKKEDNKLQARDLDVILGKKTMIYFV